MTTDSQPPIIPVLLCGGSGTRLWPLSRKSYPKQFSKLIGDHSLFQSSVLRCSGPQFAAPLILSNSDFRFIVTEQMFAIGCDPAAILIEPDARNTAPAVLAAAYHVAATDPDAVLLISPSDHVIPDARAFAAAVARGMDPVMRGDLVTFGITPDRAETGYGYLELGEAPQSDSPVALTSFVEKPDAARARTMVETGRFLWNAGIFMGRARDFITAFQNHAPELLAPVATAVETATPDLGFLRLNPKSWAKAPDISVDYAVMEKAANLSVVPYAGKWSDLGGWDAVWQESGPDQNGLVTTGEATAIDCRDTLLRSDTAGVEMVGIGLDNILAVAMGDAVLVADKSRSQDIKLAVSSLRQKGARQATHFPKDHRPWGWFETLVLGNRFQVKRITVKPGGSLSLQSHVHRAEHWIVVEGTGKVTIEDKIYLVTENESVYVPLGAKHRLENPGKMPVVLIEVQTGSYFGEDDIQRYEDIYARPEMGD